MGNPHRHGIPKTATWYLCGLRGGVGSVDTKGSKTISGKVRVDVWKERCSIMQISFLSKDEISVNSTLPGAEMQLRGR